MAQRNITRSIFLFVFALFSAGIKAQHSYTISGTVKSKNTGESIIGASVRIINQQGGTSSNEYGFYSLTLPEGTYQLVVGFVGKKGDTMNINLKKNVQQNIFLEDEITSL